MIKDLAFSNKTVTVHFETPLQKLQELAPPSSSIIITDENVFSFYQADFAAYRTITLPAGEKHKQQATVDLGILQLLELGADRNTLIVGVGGGVVTDLAGYIASIFMRGIPFAFVPTTILAMVDACVGGKNGVDVGVYKNLVGTINQPRFLLYDYSVLKTLPIEQWRSGFAEIIKHACIRDADMFGTLQQQTLEYYLHHLEETGKLIERNVMIKYDVVSGDENETGARKLLNFGHTIGHAIENVTGLLHGYAISVGMAAACNISQVVTGFTKNESEAVVRLLERYGLPVSYNYSKADAWNNLLYDKKKAGSNMNFVVLKKIGEGDIESLPLTQLKELYENL